MKEKEVVSLEELIKLIEESENASSLGKKEESSKYNSVDSFIASKAVKAGLDRVPNFVIYYEYRKYEIKNPLSKHKFFIEFNKKFTRVRTGEQRAYLLDGSSFDLSREGKMIARKYQDDRKTEKQKKRQIKK